MARTGSTARRPNGPFPDDIGSQEAGTARGQVPRGEGEYTDSCDPSLPVLSVVPLDSPFAQCTRIGV